MGEDVVLLDHERVVLAGIVLSMLGVPVQPASRLIVPVGRVASFCEGMSRRQVRFDLAWLVRKGLVEIDLHPGSPDMCGLTAAGVAMVVAEHAAQVPHLPRAGSEVVAVRSPALDKGAGRRRAASSPDRVAPHVPPDEAA